jgi:hypothetical protein
MSGKPKLASTLAGLMCVAVASMPHAASAVTVEVPKKCSALTARAFPPRAIGNPGAGSAKGTGREEQAYFKRCVASGGKIDEETQE